VLFIYCNNAQTRTLRARFGESVGAWGQNVGRTFSEWGMSFGRYFGASILIIIGARTPSHFRLLAMNVDLLRFFIFFTNFNAHILSFNYF
jgi:hypothetical protein